MTAALWLWTLTLPAAMLFAVMGWGLAIMAGEGRATDGRIMAASVVCSIGAACALIGFVAGVPALGG